jgi:hypothetical protein
MIEDIVRHDGKHNSSRCEGMVVMADIQLLG